VFHVLLIQTPTARIQGKEEIKDPRASVKEIDANKYQKHDVDSVVKLIQSLTRGVVVKE
jgi:hypothetical protein